MTLRLLAGPIMLKNLDGTPWEGVRYGHRPFWSDELDAFILGGDLIQLDGTVTTRNSTASQALFYDFALNKMALNGTSGGLAAYYRNVDWWTLRPHVDEPAVINEFTWDGTIREGAQRVLLPDRYLMMLEEPYSETGYLYAFDYATNTPVQEAVLPVAAFPGIYLSNTSPWIASPFANTTFIPGTIPGRTFFMVGYNQAVEYDYISKQYLGWHRRLSHIGDPVQAAVTQYFDSLQQYGGPEYTEVELMAYSPKLGVWFGFDWTPVGRTTADFWDYDHWEERLWVYADEAVPTSMTAPTTLSTNLRVGQAATYRVKVTGSLGEPCVNLPVNWSGGTYGRPVNPTTLTDVGGWAEATISFLFPDHTAPSDATTVTAQVEI